MINIIDIATEAAARLNLTRGRDNKWRGRCPACGYAKPTLEVAVEQDRLAVSCKACGAVAGIAAMMGVAPDIVIAPSVQPSKVARATNAWRKADSATGSLVESYLRGRGIICAPPASIRFLRRQRNWADGGTYPAMISLVQRVPGDDDHAALEHGASLIDTGAHFTYLQGGGPDGPVVKAATEASKLTLGQLRHGGVWLTPVEKSASNSPSPRASRRHFPSCRLRNCRQSRRSVRRACGRCDGLPRFAGCGSLRTMIKRG